MLEDLVTVSLEGLFFTLLNCSISPWRLDLGSFTHIRSITVKLTFSVHCMTFLNCSY